MSGENSLWGQERIASELCLKLRLRVSSRTVRRYLPNAPAGRPRGDQRWSTFLKNFAQAIVACDFFVVVTSTFRLLYVLAVICGADPSNRGNWPTLRIAQVTLLLSPRVPPEVARPDSESHRQAGKVYGRRQQALEA